MFKETTFSWRDMGINFDRASVSMLVRPLLLPHYCEEACVCACVSNFVHMSN